jgi:hypothetical protein
LPSLRADSLAYLTAATHGLTEEADSIAETLSARLDKVGVDHHIRYNTVVWSIGAYISLHIYMYIKLTHNDTPPLSPPFSLPILISNILSHLSSLSPAP